MIRVELKDLLERRGISQRELARRIGRHHDVVSRFARQDTTAVTYELLGEICAVLDCQPGDIIRYQPGPEVQIPLFESTDSRPSVHREQAETSNPRGIASE